MQKDHETMSTLALSVLDLAPISEGFDTATALGETVALAQAAEAMGYRRMWFAEHHGMPSIGSASPEVLIASAAARTQKIRLGSGGVMLLNHAPLRIVEAFRTLAALFPGRIDLGLGRAPGGDGYAMRAMRSGGGEEFSHYLAELLAFENEGFPEGHPLGRVMVAPGGVDLPPIYMLGSSGASAAMAGELGMGYAFAAHFSAAPAGPAFEAYRKAFVPSPAFPKPHAILCVSAICAETDEEAEFLSGSQALSWALFHSGEIRRLVTPEEAARHDYTEHQRAIIERQRPLWIVGGRQTVADTILRKAAESGADEVMISTQMHSYDKRRDSYRLIAEALGPSVPLAAE
jgi:luciferase family oxidoreductase group 1